MVSDGDSGGADGDSDGADGDGNGGGDGAGGDCWCCRGRASQFFTVGRSDRLLGHHHKHAPPPPCRPTPLACPPRLQSSFPRLAPDYNNHFPAAVPVREREGKGRKNNYVFDCITSEKRAPRP